MTLNEYAQIVGNNLVNAHNNKNMAAITNTFREADQTLQNSNIGTADRKEFWEDVRKVVNSGRLLTERQANNALIVLMHAIERELVSRTGKAK